MSTVQPLYGTANQPITCTITSLASATLQQSATIDNSLNLYLDISLTIKAKSNSTTVSGSGTLEVYAGAMTDGSTFDGGLTGTNSSYTPPVALNGRPSNLKLVGMLVLNATSQTDQATFSIAQAFGGQLPQKFALAVYNSTGGAIDASVGSMWYQGIQSSIA
ncbi:MAG TPA: hypothetical protein VHZ55_10130 [Bryobacteraceae bacterium]|jgi:hypothetical protein|nr:hypothetical protein [Bryobacteraceae bacterium]